MENGWIKIHRKLWTNAIAKKPAYAWLWITLLAMANHKGAEFIWNNKKQKLKKGQVLTGRKKLAKKTGIAESRVYRILKYLESEQQIEQQKTTKFTVITIVNWDRYQQIEQQNEQQANNKRTTGEQQANTYKKNKKDKKNKKESMNTLSKFIKNKETILRRISELYPDKNGKQAYEDFVEHCQIKKVSYKDYALAYKRWVREDRFSQYQQEVYTPPETDAQKIAKFIKKQK